VAVGASENFYRYASTSLSAPAGWAHVKGRVLTHMLASIFEAELQDVIPICHATIAGTRIIGRLTAGYVSPARVRGAAHC
jgi:hypothetical protein